MSQRRTSHEQFRDLFNKQSATNVSNRTRPSTKSKSGKAIKTPSKKKGAASIKSAKSAKSIKKNPVSKKGNNNNNNNTRTLTSTVMTNTESKECPTSRGSNGRVSSKSPHTARTPGTPSATTANTPTSGKRTPSKKKAASPEKWNGKEVEEKTLVCKTIFENDAGNADGEDAIKVAETRVKQRKLQWKKDEKSPAKTDTHQMESSAAQDETEKKEEKKEAKVTEANKTLRDRTIFENDESPAEVKEEKAKLQWLKGAAKEEPAARKKKASESAEEHPKPAAKELEPTSMYVAPVLNHKLFAPSAENPNIPSEELVGKKQ